MPPLFANSMFRARGENLRSVYILLFLNIAFFLLQFQDGEKFARLFTFNSAAVMHGEVWRLFSYQFVQATKVGALTIPPVITLFLNLVLLSLMGLAVEEAWGTRGFLTLYLISTFTSAGVAAYLGVPLLGSYFINFTLLFVYAALHRDQSFFAALAIPVRVTMLAWLALGALIAGVVFGSSANIAALAGAATGFGYYLTQRRRPEPQLPAEEDDPIILVTRNVTRVAAVKRALALRSDPEIDRLIALCEKEMTAGVNICPPVDYKPEHNDRYCIRCEGFAECTARHLRTNRPLGVTAAPAAAPAPARAPLHEAS